MEKKYSMPIYHKIALDIANKIHLGEIEEGSLLKEDLLLLLPIMFLLRQLEEL